MSNFFLRNLGFPSLKSWFNVLSVLMFKEISRKGKKKFHQKHRAENYAWKIRNMRKCENGNRLIPNEVSEIFREGSVGMDCSLFGCL